jgi:antitoxin MazE
MKLSIIAIGNSQGIRIPKALLKQCGFQDKVIIKVVKGNLVLSPDIEPRQGWEEAFKKMAKFGDDRLLDEYCIESSFDKEEWEW